MSQVSGWNALSGVWAKSISQVPPYPLNTAPNCRGSEGTAGGNRTIAFENAAGTESSLQHPDLLISNFLHHTQHWETVSQVGSRHGKKLSGDHTGPHCPEEQ